MSGGFIVVGAGIFGVAAALELRQRGHLVTLVDPGPIPHPLAESTDISKVVRLDYGKDADYLALMESAMVRWRDREGPWGRTGFHETGIAFLTQGAMEPGTFEHESMRLLLEHGHRPQTVDAAAIRARFPAWNADRYVAGYFNPEGGWAQSGAIVARLTGEAADAGVTVLAGRRVARLLESGGRVIGVAGDDGDELRADGVVIATGAWTPYLVPEVARCFRTVGQPVFHLAPTDPSAFRADLFPVFCADISRSGWYGFPANADGVVKIANHGVGRPMHPEGPERAVTAEEVDALREFLRATFPGLADAPIVHTRVCVYCDTLDGHFWIAGDPARPGLCLAAGGSGHGFKFAPVLGELIADAAEALPNPMLEKFRWRPELRGAHEEAARHRG